MGLELLLVGILVAMIVLLVEHSILWNRSFCWCLGHRSLFLRFPSPHIHPIKLPEKRPSQPTLMFSLHVLQQTCALAQCTNCVCYIWVRAVREGGGAPIREMEHIRIRSLNPNDSFPVVAELSSPEPEGSHTYANVRLRHGKLNSFFCKRLPQSNASIQPNGKEHEKCSHVWGLRFEKHLLITEAAGTLGVEGKSLLLNIFRSQSILNFDQKSISHQSHWVIFDDQRLALKSFSWLLKHQAELCDVDCGTSSTKIFVWPTAQFFSVPFKNCYLDQIKE